MRQNTVLLINHLPQTNLLVQPTNSQPKMQLGPNLEPLSAFFLDMNGAASSYASLSTSITHNGHASIRLAADRIRGTREDDGAWINVHPGDHIYAGVWAKTDPNTANGGNPDIYRGARVGIDLCAQTSAGYGVVDGIPHDYTIINGLPVSQWQNTPVSRFQLPYDNDWTLIYWNITVPDNYYDRYNPGNENIAVTPVQINSLVMWFDARELTDGPYVYFSDPFLYVNP